MLAEFAKEALDTLPRSIPESLLDIDPVALRQSKVALAGGDHLE
jgi:hypothetical protein